MLKDFYQIQPGDNTPKKIISYHAHSLTHIDYDWQGRMYAWESENLVELQLIRKGFWLRTVSYAKAAKKYFRNAAALCGLSNFA